MSKECPHWSQEEKNLLRSMISTTLPGSTHPTRRDYESIAQDMNTETARLGIQGRVYTSEGVRARWRRMEIRPIVAATEVKTATLTAKLPSLQEAIHSPQLDEPDPLPPLQVGFESVQKPSIPGEDLNVEASGPSSLR
jgi:hypothetical protein